LELCAAVLLAKLFIETGRNGRGLYWKPRSMKYCGAAGGGEIMNI
jgi:hypothetical protein